MTSDKTSETCTAAKTILIPLPAYGFDPTESAVPWKALKEAHQQVVFATPEGLPAAADIRMLTGQDLPKLLRKSLMAEPAALEAYRQMQNSPGFQHPIPYADLRENNYNGLLLPGGHDKGMRPYLESPELQKMVAHFFANDKPVAAICHGALLVGRSLAERSLAEKSAADAPARSVLWGRKTTGLTRAQEVTAYHLTRLWLGDYYRTYETPMADELVTYLKSAEDFAPGPGFLIPTRRDSSSNLKSGFVVKDGKYISARWPGDAYSFAAAFIDLLGSTPQS